MRKLWRRRRRTVLVAICVLLIGSALTVQLLRSRVAEYTAGEQTDGLVDTLARDLPAGYPPVRFTDVAAEAGLVFDHFDGKRTNRLPEDMGSGVALGDVNGDGWPDALLVNAIGSAPESPRADGRTRLFLNQGDGTFTDATDSSGIDLVEQGMAAAFCDVDSDGALDLFVTTFGTCRLYLNDGTGRFHDASSEAGLDEHEGFWTGVAVGDYDEDGAVDLYVCGYVVYDEADKTRQRGSGQYGVVIPALINPSVFEADRNLLLAGNGDGTFREVAAEVGVANESGRSLGALFCDLNGDGFPDIYVANDVSDNALFLNRGDGTFVERTTEALLGDYRGAMGLAASDFDGDLDLDLFITHWVAQENALYVQFPREATDGGPPVPLYMDKADSHGLGYQGLDRVGWATRFFDYDNDGNQDLFVVNGHTIPVEGDAEHLEPMKTQLFWRSPDERRFFDVGPVSGDFFQKSAVGRGGATFDYDLDGDEDMVVVLHGGRAALLRNDGGNAKPCLRLRLRQPEGNRFALGAEVYARIGERTWFDVLGSQGSYLSQHAVGEVAIGVGEGSQVDGIEVVWPDGVRESAGPFLAHSLVTWVRGERPRAEPLPGRRELDENGPVEADGQRAFFALRKRARDARLAGELEQAVELYREALVSWPGHGDCLYYLGNSLLGLGHEAAALDAFARLVYFESQSNKGWMQIGLLRLPGGDETLDDLAAAKGAFGRCYELNSEESRPILQLGVVAMLEGELDEAARMFAQAGGLNPRSIEARWFGGRVAYLSGERDQAEQLLTAAHELAAATGAGESASNEGDTASGAAMTAAPGIELAGVLTRWRSVGERPVDVDLEYGDLD